MQKEKFVIKLTSMSLNEPLQILAEAATFLPTRKEVKKVALYIENH